MDTPTRTPIIVYYAREYGQHLVPLRAKTEASAKREALKLLGGGFPGNTIYLEEDLGEGVRISVAYCIIGTPGWDQL